MGAGTFGTNCGAAVGHMGVLTLFHKNMRIHCKENSASMFSVCRVSIAASIPEGRERGPLEECMAQERGPPEPAAAAQQAPH